MSSPLCSAPLQEGGERGKKRRKESWREKNRENWRGRRGKWREERGDTMKKERRREREREWVREKRERGKFVLFRPLFPEFEAVTVLPW